MTESTENPEVTEVTCKTGGKGAPDEESYELTPLQEGMLIHSLGDRGVGMYISQSVFAFEQIETEAMEQAWQMVVNRHEVLRTAFRWEGVEKPQQIVCPNVTVKFEIHDIEQFSGWEQRMKLRALLAEDRNRGFDLSSAPLFRLMIYKRDEQSCYLVFSHHHILLDGWSIPILLKEVRTFYQAILRGRKITLSLPRPFRFYVQWLRRQVLEKEEIFWRDYLKGVTGATPLPSDLGAQRQTGLLLTSKEWKLEIEEPLFQVLQTTARKCKVTLNTIVQAAWAIILQRYSGRQNVVFGTLVSGRPPSLEGVESMIGMFLNTLPMHVAINQDAPLNEWLRYLHSQQTTLQEHEFCPLSLVTKWSEIPRGASLFESIIDLNNTHQPGEESYDDTVFTPINQNVPLLLLAKPASNKLMIVLYYNSLRFSTQSIIQLGNQIVALFESMSENIRHPISKLSMLSAKEAHRIIVLWNETDTYYPKESLLHTIFEKQAESTPDVPAVYYLDELLTYCELNQKANKLAHYLYETGISSGGLVGLCIERSPDMVIALLAILKCGAAYVPLDPAYPIERLQMMLTNSGAGLLISREKLMEGLAHIAPRTLCIESESQAWAEQKTVNPNLPLHSETIAYVLYTSGSTGEPKGVVIPHRVAVNRMFIEFDPFEPDEALCAKTSLSFVDSIWELFSAWNHGLAVTLIPEDHVKDPQLLIDTLAKAGATRIVLVPSLLRSIFNAEPDPASALPKLKHWICSGEALPTDLWTQFIKLLPDAVLTNLYGTSEVWDATRCDTREELPYKNMPIGKPMGNMQTYVLDENLSPVPPGIIGELYVGGVHLAHGYWNRPDLTARQFIPNPFGSEQGGRLYKTGDLVRWLPDGNIEYIGRSDQQVKLRGFRIELGEIESVIRSHRAISQAAVTVTDDERLVAYIVAENSSHPGSAELRKHVRSHLPEHMTPAFYLPIESIPLTPNGKTDRKRLPIPNGDDLREIAEKESLSRTPETSMEKSVAQVWAAILRMGAVGAETDFFQLGGDSLLAARIVTQLGKELNINIPLSALMETRTVAGLAEWIEKAEAKGDSDLISAPPELTRTEHGKRAPLSYSQQQMWFLDQLNPGSVSYTLPNIMRFSFNVDLKVLNRALTEVIIRHGALRTTFSSIDGEPFQVINEPQTVEILLTDLTSLPAENRDTMARKQIGVQARLPWDLANGPLMRYQLFKLGEEDYIFAMTLHHIATDGHSLGILSHEILTLYNSYQYSRPSPLAELPIQYADYAVWQREWLKGEQLESQLSYWKEKLDSVEVLELHTDKPRPAVNRYQGAGYTITINKKVVNALHELAQEEGATMFMILLTFFQLLLARYTNRDDICVGTPVANRSQPELEKLIGYFVNIVVIRTQIEEDSTFRQLLKSVRTNCLQAYDHQEAPFEKVVDALGVQRDLGHNPLFQVLFVHQKLIGEQSGAVAHQRGPAQETSNFDLVLNAQESQESMECTLLYNSDLFESDTMKRMCMHLELLIEQCTANPDRALSQTSMLHRSEEQQILQTFSLQESKSLEKRLAHEIIAEHAKSTPHKIAVQMDEEILTFAALEEEANKMARHLQKLGVGPETVVGWCVERTPRIFVGLLGIMKSGGAFLPLDPAHPQERLEYMIKDSGTVVVITQKKLSERFPDALCPIVLLDEDKNTIAGYDTTAPHADVKQNNLAYIIYTSGSTGLPKGVMIEHGNLANLISVHIPKFQITKEARVLQTLSLSFDAAMGEIFRTLVAGATLYLVHKDDLMPGPQLIELLRSLHISVATFSAAALAALPRASDQLPELKCMSVGGDTSTPDLLAHWCKNRRLMNGYGPSETTIGATLAVNWDVKGKPPLGPPLPNVEAYVLDNRMRPVPVGIPGELYIGGIGVSRGYINRPDQTAKAFVPNPFSTLEGARLYRTGDQVRWMPDGKLDFLGRIDQQVKIRGYRIELSEIESVLSSHEQIHQTVVIVHSEKGVKRLAAYVTGKGDSKPDISELRTFLKNRVPDYMTPAFFMVCESLPMTVNGKIDRKALPRPSADQLEPEQQYVAPETETEKIIASIWADVLGLEKVGIHSNFFELGGDSIMSIRVVARITEAGYNLTPKEMFKHQTVSELASALKSGSIVVEADQGVITGDVPLTPVQHWFFEQKPINPHYFNQWMVIPTSPLLESKKMGEALSAVIKHHDALRMRYRKIDLLNWWQYNTDVIEPIPFSTVDLSTVEESGRAEIIKRELNILQNSLDLEQGPLLQVCWFNGGPNQGGRLVVVVHHIVMDIVSWSALVEDLMKAYRQLDKAEQISLPAKTTSFRQWALDLNHYVSSQQLQAEIPYWLGIAQNPPQSLPMDDPDGDHTLTSTQILLVELEHDKTKELIHQVTQYFQAQLSHILLSALAIALNRFSGNRQIQVKVEGQGREDIGVEMNLARTVGWFTSFYPVSMIVNSDKELKQQVTELLHQIQAIPNRGIGYSVLRYLDSGAAVKSGIKKIAESEVTFNFTGQSGVANQNETVQVEDEREFWHELADTGKIQLAESQKGNRRHLIEVGAGVMGGRLIARFAYGGKRFKESTIQHLSDTFINTLEAICRCTD